MKNHSSTIVTIVKLVLSLEKPTDRTQLYPIPNLIIDSEFGFIPSMGKEWKRNVGIVHKSTNPYPAAERQVPRTTNFNSTE